MPNTPRAIEAPINARLEALCEGALAIAMTLLIIDVARPPGTT